MRDEDDRAPQHGSFSKKFAVSSLTSSGAVGSLTMCGSLTRRARCYALALSARKLVGLVIGAVGETDGFKNYAFAPLAPLPTPA